LWAVPLPELIYAKLICVKLEFHGGRDVHFGNKKSFRPKYTFVCRGLYTVVGAVEWFLLHLQDMVDEDSLA